VKSGEWGILPGLPGASLYPFLRKVDITSSNSYLISFTDAIVVIDPGAVPDQAECILKEVKRLQLEQWRPVIICLTHVHVDHCKSALNYPGFCLLPGRLLAAQKQGAIALEGQDRKATIADIMQQDLVAVRVDIHLLDGDEVKEGTSRIFTTSGKPLTILDKPVIMDGGQVFLRQILTLDNGDEIEVYHTPGHSPDSICIRVGKTLFIGDLLFATAPGIAGITGWDRQELGFTIEKILCLLSRGGIDTCLPGHGRPLDVSTTIRILEAMQKEAEQLDGIEAINPEWVRETSLFAQSLMGEVDRLFTIIAGRLVYVSHVLEELEERGEALRMEKLIDTSLVDELLTDFNGFSRDFHAGNKPDIHLALKAGQISAKLERLFHKEDLRTVLDYSLIRRISRLLEDYNVTIRGFRPLSNIEVTDLSIAVGDIVSARATPPYHDDDIILAEDEEAFARALALRIAWVNPFQRVEFEYSPALSIPLALMDRERFEDTAILILEKLAVAGVSRVRMATSDENEELHVIIEAPRKQATILDEKASLFAARSTRLSGGEFSDQSDNNVYRVVLSYPKFKEAG